MAKTVMSFFRRPENFIKPEALGSEVDRVAVVLLVKNHFTSLLTTFPSEKQLQLENIHIQKAFQNILRPSENVSDGRSNPFRFTAINQS
ncbi:hypothetical protein [Neisseria dentiae]|uniref:hypothetical protein n=1 Tax=Neisseria dentiae TaxID=194197 RepID=UPI000A1980BD|nr:hypothetical protein [Neisseria dentiae]QMT44507.1 hypothetical protein H3L92_08505 [Neisseria dentiae]STZ50200.1 Uncharacterised protein [Neisseria dentiae]